MICGFVRQGAGLGHNTDVALFEYKTRHDAHFGLICSDDTWTVGTDEGRTLGYRIGLGFHHICYRNALGDANYDFDASICRFHDRIRCKRRRDKKNRNIRTRRIHRILHRIKHRLVQVCLSAFSGRHAANDIGAVGDHLFGMEGAFFAGKTLNYNLGVFIYENAHTYEY